MGVWGLWEGERSVWILCFFESRDLGVRERRGVREEKGLYGEK